MANPIVITIEDPKCIQPPKRLRVFPSYIYCGICGHDPGPKDPPNHGAIRWWDPDDGWKIGTLCNTCARENVHIQPKAGDYAYRGDGTEPIAEANTDEDITFALEDMLY